ncbi:MAG: SWIM zinc finger family protein, partial [Victivallales bacterium]|nr:SWIM zinc finger family protein [Victivallales bacterium]
MRPSEKYQQNFPADVRQDGEALRDQATRLWGGDDRISCEFPDGCTAKLEVVSHLLTSSCTCARFAQGRPCPHIWATLRIADWHEDLAVALKKNCPRKISLASASSAGGESQIVYEKTRTAPRALRPKVQMEEEGRLLEYAPAELPRQTPARPG